ncbi:MnmC family methyltransferase [Piscirickettsia salmonis]
MVVLQHLHLRVLCRALTQAGFVVKKIPGFAGKREMMRGWETI